VAFGDSVGTASVHGLEHGLPHETFPDGRRFFLAPTGVEGQQSVIVDASGRGLAVLKGGERGRYETPLVDFDASVVHLLRGSVVGREEVDRGETIAKWVVFVVDTSGTDRFPVDGAPYSVRLHCSRVGHWLALDRLDGGLEVGTLEVDR